MATQLGVVDVSHESLAKFDNFYLGYYPYLLNKYLWLNEIKGKFDRFLSKKVSSKRVDLVYSVIGFQQKSGFNFSISSSLPLAMPSNKIFDLQTIQETTVTYYNFRQGLNWNKLQKKLIQS